MPIKNTNPQASEQTTRKERLTAVVDLLEWDVEVLSHATSKNGNMYAKLRISKENSLRYNVTAFGKVAEEIVNGTYKHQALEVSIAYDFDQNGNIRGLALFVE